MKRRKCNDYRMDVKPVGCTLVFQIKGVSLILAHRSIYQKHIGYFTNGYSPIYFTNEALISIKVAPQ
jgi:hypothetical protein